jgi:hypothetical protein
MSGNRIVALVVAVAVVVVAAGAFVISRGGSDDHAAGKKEHVQLVSVTTPGPNPFTPPAAPAAPPATTIAPAQPPYGGTGDNTLCDREGIISYLTDPANAAQARAWVGVLGITEAQIPSYIRDLVPTTITQDIRITNHTFENGQAIAFEAVLEAGTAVLVDVYGKPVVRCRCGNPLLPPRTVSDPVYVGQKWPGFSPTNVVVVNINTTIQVFPPGGVGTIPPPSSTTTATTRPKTTTTTAGGSADQAAALMKQELDSCIRTADFGDEGFFTADDLEEIIASLQYTVTPGSVPGVFSVSVTAAGGTGEIGIWSVTPSTGAIVSANPNAAELDPYCTNFHA